MSRPTRQQPFVIRLGHQHWHRCVDEAAVLDVDAQIKQWQGEYPLLYHEIIALIHQRLTLHQKKEIPFIEFSGLKPNEVNL